MANQAQPSKSGHKDSKSHKIIKLRRHMQEFIREMKNTTPCTDCHKMYPYYVMEFDHIGTNKVGNISDMSRKTLHFKKVFEELAKCEIVCSNCHKIRTYHRAIRQGSLTAKRASPKR